MTAIFPKLGSFQPQHCTDCTNPKPERGPAKTCFPNVEIPLPSLRYICVQYFHFCLGWELPVRLRAWLERLELWHWPGRLLERALPQQRNLPGPGELCLLCLAITGHQSLQPWVRNLDQELIGHNQEPGAYNSVKSHCYSIPLNFYWVTKI